MSQVVRHPVATGAAKALADKHVAEQPLKLYAGWFCPYAQRTWITLEEKKIPYQYIETNPYDKSPSLLALNPKGLVPTIGAPLPNNQGTNALYESNIINEYLEEAYPDHTPHLLPKDPFERARARIWIDFVGSRITPNYRKIQYAKSTEERDAARAEFLKAVKEFTREMDPEGPYFLGEEIGLPDIALAPWVARFFMVEKFKEGGTGIPAEGEGGKDEGVWRRWRKWEAAIKGRESFKNTFSERVYYENIATQEWAR
ncbi:glutathione S-transferase [Histoplasma ohiense]|nr:glutathione S-transferase [Histoplasma ohiense (nom. inval.)]